MKDYQNMWQNRLFKFLLSALFLFWPWQTRWIWLAGENEYLTRSLYASDILVAALLGAYLLALVRRQKKTESRLGPADAGWREFNLFFVGLVPVAVLALLQFFCQTTWPTKWLGLAYHDAGQLGQAVIETANSERWLRAYGSFDHPNILGGVMVIALLALIIKTRRGADYLDGVYAVLFAGALFVSFSRAAWLGLLIGIFVFVVLYVFKNRAKGSGSIKDYLFILSVISVVGLLFFYFYHDLVLARTTASGRLESKSINERVSYYAEAKELFLAEPWLGVGFRQYVPSLMEHYPDRPVWSYQPVHNSLALLAVELGIVRLLSIIALVVLILKLKIKNLLASSLLPIYLSVFVMMNLDHWWWSLHAGWIMIGLLALIGVKLLQEN